MSESNSVKPLVYIILLNVIGAVLIMMSYGEINREALVLTGAFCLVSIISYLMVTLLKMGDPYLYLIISVLGTVGGIMQLRIKPAYGIRQLKWFLLGTACYFLAVLVYMLLSKSMIKLTPILFGASILLYILTFLFGKTSHGSRNWIVIGSLSIQPGELIRIFYVLILAAVFTAPLPKKIKDNPKIHPNGVRLVCASAITAINVMFLLLQREWGIMLLFFMTYFCFLYVYGASKGYLVLNVFAAAIVGYVGVTHMSHIQTRIEIWKDPFADASGKGYQIIQSMFAIGEGGFAGRGIGRGSVYFIPEVHSDFIFSAICEEMGVLGGMAIVMLYFVLTYRAFKIALSCMNKYNKAVAFGLSFILGLQTFVIIGGVTKMIPLTGITLPFVSYGGSSMLTTFGAYGILQAISATKKEVSDEI